MDLKLEMIQSAVDKTWKKSVVKFCHEKGLLQFRAVRWVLNVDIETLTKNVKLLADKQLLNKTNYNNYKKDFSDLLNKDWKVFKADKWIKIAFPEQPVKININPQDSKLTNKFSTDKEEFFKKPLIIRESKTETLKPSAKSTVADNEQNTITLGAIEEAKVEIYQEFAPLPPQETVIDKEPPHATEIDDNKATPPQRPILPEDVPSIPVHPQIPDDLPDLGEIVNLSNASIQNQTQISTPKPAIPVSFMRRLTNLFTGTFNDSEKVEVNNMNRDQLKSYLHKELQAYDKYLKQLLKSEAAIDLKETKITLEDYKTKISDLLVMLQQKTEDSANSKSLHEIPILLKKLEKKETCILALTWLENTVLKNQMDTPHAVAEIVKGVNEFVKKVNPSSNFEDILNSLNGTYPEIHIRFNPLFKDIEEATQEEKMQFSCKNEFIKLHKQMDTFYASLADPKTDKVVILINLRSFENQIDKALNDLTSLQIMTGYSESFYTMCQTHIDEYHKMLEYTNEMASLIPYLTHPDSLKLSDKQLEKINPRFNELVENEKNYQQVLHILVEFKKYLFNTKMIEKTSLQVDSEDYKFLENFFNDIENKQKLSLQLLDDIKQKGLEKPDNVVKIFLSKNFMQTYENVKDYEKAQEIAKKYNINERFTSFKSRYKKNNKIEKDSPLSNTLRQDIDGFMIFPMQHICRYPLYLGEVIKAAKSKDSQDVSPAAIAFKVVKNHNANTAQLLNTK